MTERENPMKKNQSFGQKTIINKTGEY